MSLIGTFQTWRNVRLESVFGGKADMGRTSRHVSFSNRPFGVKRFQTIHHCNVDVARGLVLLFGIGASALPSWDSKTRRNNLLVGLAVNRTAGPSRHANSPHTVGLAPQNLQQGVRFARYLYFLHDPARVIHNADAGLLDRYVQSAKMVHAALLLLMLEAVTTDLVFTISLKRSTQNLQLSTSWAGRLHHLLARFDVLAASVSAKWP